MEGDVADVLAVYGRENRLKVKRDEQKANKEKAEKDAIHQKVQQAPSLLSFMQLANLALYKQPCPPSQANRETKELSSRQLVILRQGSRVASESSSSSSLLYVLLRKQLDGFLAGSAQAESEYRHNLLLKRAQQSFGTDESTRDGLGNIDQPALQATQALDQGRSL